MSRERVAKICDIKSKQVSNSQGKDSARFIINSPFEKNGRVRPYTFHFLPGIS